MSFKLFMGTLIAARLPIAKVWGFGLSIAQFKRNSAVFGTSPAGGGGKVRRTVCFPPPFTGEVPAKPAEGGTATNGSFAWLRMPRIARAPLLKERPRRSHSRAGGKG